jgi:glucan endo-1,6-beta-glucosidase
LIDIGSSQSSASLAYDDHFYPKYDLSAEEPPSAYLDRVCTTIPQSADSNPLIIGEWSLSPNDGSEYDEDFAPSDSTKPFYRQYWAAQVRAYEKNALGWVFWSWKTTGGRVGVDPRWNYRYAVEQGYIGRPDEAYDVEIPNESCKSLGA